MRSKRKLPMNTSTGCSKLDSSTKHVYAFPTTRSKEQRANHALPPHRKHSCASRRPCESIPGPTPILLPTPSNPESSLHGLDPNTLSSIESPQVSTGPTPCSLSTPFSLGKAKSLQPERKRSRKIRSHAHSLCSRCVPPASDAATSNPQQPLVTSISICFSFGWGGSCFLVIVASY